MLNNKVILITGGTGSFGKKATEIILKKYKPKKLIIFSRDEFKQFEMQQLFSFDDYPCIRYFIGDVRDKSRLMRAFQDVDYVIHAAALKHVPVAEYNPFEAIQTNVIGAENVINASLDTGVNKVIALSTDKAVSPINLYGATKLCSDKMFVAANSFGGTDDTIFSVVRYGNVIGSRGSVIPFFNKIKHTGRLPITDPRMTRFWISLEQGVQTVLNAFDIMVGGEIFVPKMPSTYITDLAKAICPECETEIIGIRPGEKLHEGLISKDDARNTVDMDKYYIIKPEFPYFKERFETVGGTAVADDFEFSSNTNEWFLSVDEIKETIDKFLPED